MDKKFEIGEVLLARCRCVPDLGYGAELNMQVAVVGNEHNLTVQLMQDKTVPTVCELCGEPLEALCWYSGPEDEREKVSA